LCFNYLLILVVYSFLLFSMKKGVVT